MTVSTEADSLIAGVGHLLMGDDCLGLEAIGKREECGPLERMRLFYSGASPLDILGELSGIHRLIIVDALTGVAPGTIIKQRLALAYQTLTLVQELHPDIDIIIIGAGAKPEAAFSSALTPHIRERIPELIQIINEEIASPIMSN
jgi:hydrogenase maturation protease